MLFVGLLSKSLIRLKTLDKLFKKCSTPSRGQVVWWQRSATGWLNCDGWTDTKETGLNTRQRASSVMSTARRGWIDRSRFDPTLAVGDTWIQLLNLKNYLNLVIWVCLVQFGIDRKVAFLVGLASKYQVWFFPGFWCPRTQIVGWLTRIHLKQYKWRVAWENSLINYALVSFFLVWKSSRQLLVSIQPSLG